MFNNIPGPLGGVVPPNTGPWPPNRPQPGQNPGPGPGPYNSQPGQSGGGWNAGGNGAGNAQQGHGLLQAYLAAGNPAFGSPEWQSARATGAHPFLDWFRTNHPDWQGQMGQNGSGFQSLAGMGRGQRLGSLGFGPPTSRQQ